MVSKMNKQFNKIPKTNIVIDFWKAVDNDPYFRFMTYVKADKPQPMRFIQESTYKIYSSKFSKWYLCKFFDISRDRIEVLELAETREFYDPVKKESFCVTAFDANNCAGSLMLLFQSSSIGNVLYTGYFRLSATTNFWDEPLIKEIISEKSLDVVYIDNSYAAKHCVLPSRAEVVTQIANFLRRNNKHNVFFCGNRIGKLEVVCEIVRSLKEKVCVSELKFKLIAYMNLENFFTTNQKETRLKYFDHFLSAEECRVFEKENQPCIIISLMANLETKKRLLKGYEDISTLHIFPCSSHSSHNELMDFLSKLQPYKIKPILLESIDNDNTVIPECMRNLCRTRILLQDSEQNAEPVVDTADLEQFFSMKNGNSPDSEPAMFTSIVQDSSLNELEAVEPIKIPETMENSSSFMKNASSCEMDAANYLNILSPSEKAKENSVVVTKSPSDNINLCKIVETYSLSANNFSALSSSSRINNDASVENTRLTKVPNDTAFTSDITKDFDFANASTLHYYCQNSNDNNMSVKQFYLNHTAGSNEKKIRTLDSPTGLSQPSTNETSLEVGINHFDTNQRNKSSTIKNDTAEIETERLICRTLAGLTRSLLEPMSQNYKRKINSKGIPTRILEQYSRYECVPNLSNVDPRVIDNITEFSHP